MLEWQTQFFSKRRNVMYMGNFFINLCNLRKDKRECIVWEICLDVNLPTNFIFSLPSANFIRCHCRSGGDGDKYDELELLNMGWCQNRNFWVLAMDLDAVSFFYHFDGSWQSIVCFVGSWWEITGLGWGAFPDFSH